MDVTKVEFEGNGRRGPDRRVPDRGRVATAVALADLMPDPVTMETARLLDAYRRWLGCPLCRSADAPRRSVGLPARGVEPCPRKCAALQSRWARGIRPTSTGAKKAPRSTRCTSGSSAAGARPQFEMEQVIPGSTRRTRTTGTPIRWPMPPNCTRPEYNQEASEILHALLAQDTRCLDAWVHLGNIAFDTKGPKAALEFYDTAVAIAEQSLPEGFAGVLPRGLIDNRPFLRALHGLGLCAWRQRRWDDATVIYTNLVWIDGCQTWNALRVPCRQSRLANAGPGAERYYQS